MRYYKRVVLAVGTSAFVTSLPALKGRHRRPAPTPSRPFRAGLGSAWFPGLRPDLCLQVRASAVPSGLRLSRAPIRRLKPPAKSCRPCGTCGTVRLAALVSDRHARMQRHRQVPKGRQGVGAGPCARPGPGGGQARGPAPTESRPPSDQSRRDGRGSARAPVPRTHLARVGKDQPCGRGVDPQSATCTHFACMLGQAKLRLGTPY